jgi:hypothetical protein
MDRKHLYQIPESISPREGSANETHPYLRWRADPRLRRYVDQRIPENCLPAQVVTVAQVLVSEVQQLTGDRQQYSLPARNLSGCITALLADILFSQQKVRLVRLVEILQRHFQGTELRDVYQVSLIVISHPTKFLGNFQPQVDWYPNLCCYSHNKFQKSLTDELRRLAGDNFKRTNLSLLNRCRVARLENLLKISGHKGEQLDRLLLLHSCFQETVSAKQFVTNAPQATNYDALLARYRVRSAGLNWIEIERDRLPEILEDLSNIIRNDRQPINFSLDMSLGTDDETATTFGDLLAAPDPHVSIEHNELRQLALDLLSKNVSLSNLREDCILFLIYGLELNQTETGTALNCNQSTIGRQRDRTISKLAKQLYFSYHNLPSTTQLPIEILAAHVEYIELVCRDYYLQLGIDILTKISADLKIESKIIAGFIDSIEMQWQFKLKPEESGLKKIHTFINNHL